MRKLIWLLIFPLLGFSQTAQDVILKAEAKLRSYQTLRADFVHTYYSATVSTPLEEKGRFFLKKPDAMKWEYEDPEKKLFLYKDRLFQSYFPEEKRLERMTVTEEEDEYEILSLLSGQKNLMDNYSAEISPFPTKRPKAWQIKLTPKLEDAESFILLEINEKTWLIERIISFDWAGNKQEFHFSRIKTDISLPKNTFELKVPPDVEIIDDIR